jgi:hypothetical protein
MKTLKKPSEKRKEATGNSFSSRKFKFKNGEVVRGTGMGIKNAGLSYFGVGKSKQDH